MALPPFVVFIYTLPCLSRITHSPQYIRAPFCVAHVLISLPLFKFPALLTPKKQYK